MNKAICLVMLAMLTLGSLTLVLNVQPVKAWISTGTIYIKADGSIDPPTAPILRNGDLYTLTENIDSRTTNSGMIIERDNMTLDGAGNILQYAGPGFQGVGILLSGTTNVTIKNIEFKDFYEDLHLENSSYNKIIGNCFVSVSKDAIGMKSSNHNIISGNNMTFSGFWALYFVNSRYNTVSLNYIKGPTFYETFLIEGSINNTVYNNNLETPGLQCYGGNFFDNGYPSGGNYYRSRPKISDFFHGPYQNETGSDGILDTPLGTDRYPLVFPINAEPTLPVIEFGVESSSTPMRTGSPLAFTVTLMLPGWNGTQVMPLKAYVWDFGDGNMTSTVDRSIVHTYMDENTYNPKLTVMDDQGFNGSYSRAIEVLMSTAISISTSAASTFIGFAVDINGTLRDVHGNGLSGERVILQYTFLGANTWVPITSDTTDQLGSYDIMWIPPATGYFTIKAEWTGNSTHLGTNNTVSLSSIPYRNQYVFSVESNSTVSGMTFNSTSSVLSFTVNGQTGTRGYVKATLAKSLVANTADLHVYIDGSQTEYSVNSLGDTWVLTFTYDHSTHYVTVGWTTKTTSDLIEYLPFIAAAVIAAAVAAIAGYSVLRRRKRKETQAH